MTPRSSQACCNEGRRNAPELTRIRSPPPSCLWTRPEEDAAKGVRQVPGDTTQPAERRAARPDFSTSRSIAVQNSSSTWGTSTIDVVRWLRIDSKITRGFRLRT